MFEWNAEKIRERAAAMKATAKRDEELATLRTQFAVTLDDIADSLKGGKTGTWLGWGNKWKCSECNKVQEYKSNYCPECGAKMEVEHE